MKNKNLKIALIGSFVTFFAISNSGQAAEVDKQKTYDLLNLFGEVFERVRSQYVDDTDDQKLIESAISGMINSLDPHSSYLDQKTFSEMQVHNKGEFGGLGIEVTMENGLVKVISPIDDTPAFKAGIKPGDFFTHLDGEPVIGLTLNEAVDKMRGKVGTDIKLTVLREGSDPFDVTIIRAVIKIRTVRSSVVDNIGYVRITQFNAQALAGLEKAFDKFNKEPGKGKLRGLVVDLRSNPGGLLDQAVSISDAFLDSGEIVSIRSKKKPEESQRFQAKKGDISGGIPIVVMINGGSASASEIVAGALQDHGRAILLGTKSFGKGSVQTIQPLTGYGAIKITTSRYYTPSGRSIQSVGITPDIIVPLAKLEPIEQSKLRRERDLRGALDKDNGKTKDQKESEKTKTAPNGANDNSEATDESIDANDYQLSRAFDLIRGITLFQEMKTSERK
ncbi:MAG: S41 family peptidase [Rhodospirillaceae bacterium]|nr:S41 family peptidase [Rhodospirillaceae bacterium]